MRNLITLLLLAFVSVSHAATRVTKVASDFTLPLPFTYVADENNTPEGSWVIPFITTSPCVTGSIPLDTTFFSGSRIKIFVKVLDFDQGASFTATIGGVTSTSQQFNDRDDNQYWTSGITVTNLSDANTISFTFTRASLRDERFIAFYLTTDTNDVIYKDDRVLTFTYPTTIDTSAPNVRNQLPNGSFEVGTGELWHSICSNGNTNAYRPNELISTVQALHGTKSIVLHCPAAGGGNHTIETIPITLTATNKQHVAIVRIKPIGNNVGCNIYADSFYVAPSGFTNTLSQVAHITATAGVWNTNYVTFTNLNYPNPQITIRLLVQGIAGTPTEVYHDCVYVGEGSGYTAFDTAFPVEFAATTGEASYAFLTSDASPALTLTAYNNTGSQLTRTFNYKYVNWTNGITATNSQALTINANSAASTNITLSTNLKGHFRGMFWLTNQNNFEVTWTMTDPADVSGLDTNSYFGSHMNYTPADVTLADRLGVKARRTLSLGSLRWSIYNPSNGVIFFPDFSNFGSSFNVLANTGEDIPTWLGLPSTNLANITNSLRTFTTALVNQFPAIHNWECWNEPDQDSSEVPSWAVYGAYATSIADAVHAIRPLDRVWLGGGISASTQMDAIVAAIGTATNKFYGWTVHLYPGGEANSAAIRTSYINNGWPVRNSETGVGDKGSFSGVRQNFRTAGFYAISWKEGDPFYDSFWGNSEAVSKNLLTCLGNGLIGYDYYDAGDRNVEITDFASRQFSWTEWVNMAPRNKGAIFAALKGRVDKAVGKGSLSVGGCSSYGFDRGGVPVVAAWATNLKTVNLTGVLASNLKVYDVSGNSATPSSLALNVGPMPILVEGQGGMSYATLAAAFTGATVFNRPDTTAPNVVITMAPRISTDQPFFYFPASDDSGVPTESNASAITYRYSTNGVNWSSWSGSSFVRLASIPAYFSAQAMDQSGNIGQDFVSITGTITNTPSNPVISTITSKSILSSTSIAIPFTASDADGPVTITRSTSNTTLLPLANCVITGTGPSYTITLTPAAAQVGVSTVRVTATDGDANQAYTEFTLTVTAPVTPTGGGRPKKHKRF